MTDDVRREFGGRRQLAAELLTQYPLVKTLYRSQQRELPFWVLNQR
jgi:hypothetical protein